MSTSAVYDENTEKRKQLFTNIWLEHHLNLRKFCLRWLSGNSETADEVISITAEKAFRYIIETNIEIESPFAWLCTMSRNVCTDFLRGEIRARNLVEQVEARPDQYFFADNQSQPLEAIIENELQLNSLASEIQKLSCDYQNLLSLRFMQGLAYQEIAELTELSVVNLRKRIQLARAELRSGMETNLV